MNTCKPILLFSYSAIKTLSQYSTFSVRDFSNPWPEPLLQLAAKLQTVLYNKEDFIYTCLVRFALKNRLVTVPVAESLISGCKSICNSVDQFDLFSFVRNLPLGRSLFRFLVFGTKITLCVRFILDTIRFSKPEAVSAADYKIVDPLVQREHHGDTYVQRICNIIDDIHFKTAEAIALDKYHPFARGIGILSLACLYIVRKHFANLYFGG